MLTLYVVFTICMHGLGYPSCGDWHVDAGFAPLSECPDSTAVVMNVVADTMRGHQYSVSNQHCELEPRTGTYRVARQ